MLQASCSNVGRARSLFERSLQADPRNMRAWLGATFAVKDHCCIETMGKVTGASTPVFRATEVIALTKQMAGYFKAA